MTTEATKQEPVTLPTARTTPFDPPEELRTLREERPIARLAFPEGPPGWLVTSYSASRAVLSDTRFSRRAEFARAPVERGRAAQPAQSAPPGLFTRMGPPEHTRYRRLVSTQFGAPRIRQLEPRIRKIVDDQLAELRHQGPGTDLVQAFARPIPALVTCELLGVPYSDRDRFQADGTAMFELGVPAEQIHAAFGRITAYMYELVAAKRAEPASDLLGDLAAQGELTDEELVNIGIVLLVSALDTTTNMLALGIFALLEYPQQLAALRDKPELMDSAVDELLRYLTVAHFGTSRTALEDVELEGHTIRAGETVMLSLPAANRDPGKFPSPDELDVSRPAAGHLAFGYGVHQCLGQHLARLEMKIGYTALLTALPGLRLAVAPAEIRTREDAAIYGVAALPITWDEAEPAAQDPVVLLTRALDGVTSLIAGVTDDQLDLPTPCHAWDVRGLISHLLHDLMQFAQITEGGEPHWAGDTPEVNADRADVARIGARRLLDAWHRAGELSGTTELPGAGEVPARFPVDQQTAEFAVHSWDLARATGQHTTVDPEVSQAVLDWSATVLRPEYRGDGHDEKPFGPEMPVPPGAPVQDRLAAFFGRCVDGAGQG